MRRSILIVLLFVGWFVSDPGMQAVRADDGGLHHAAVRTMILGRVVLDDGSPGFGAVVTLMSHGGSAVAEADGSFEIEAMVPADAVALSLVATLDDEGSAGSGARVGTASGLMFGGDGVIEAGVLVVGSACVPGWVEGFGTGELSGTVLVLAVFDDGTGPALYAGGGFSLAGGQPANHIAKWDGTAWSPLAGFGGVGVNDSVRALAVFDDGTGPALYVGGTFTVAGGVEANRIARWDGRDWSAVGGPGGQGVNGTVWAMTVFDDGAGPGLYVGGQISSAGGVQAFGVARWDGASWSSVPGQVMNGVQGTVLSLAVYDDGTGPVLYVGGLFQKAGGIPAINIARWDGAEWSAVTGPEGSGTNNTGFVLALEVFDDGTGPALYVGGHLHERRWGAGESSCALGRHDLVGT